MNKSGIEWCDHTWNPITGCRHGCSYCYADKMSLRFCGNMKRNMVQTDQYRMEGDLFVLDEPFMNEDGKPVIYPFGFEPTLHIYRYGTLDKLKQLIKRCYSGKTVTIRNVSTRIRASIFLKARRKIHRFAKKIKNKKIIGSKFAMSTIAYNGWFVTTDSFLVRVAECWDQLISMAKNIISRYAKQKSYAMEKYYKKWRKLNYA